MEYTLLNGTDIKVSKAALGTATFGKDADEATSFAVMDRFAENGGNLLDTAVMYADWLPGEKSSSEKTIGKWLSTRGNRNNIVISTKGGHPQWDRMEISRLEEKDIMSDIEKSLSNLRTDYIDVYFLHRDDKTKPVSEIMETLNKIVKSGKTRSIGLSNWSTERIAEASEYCRAHNLAPVTSSQIQFGIAHPNADKIDPTTEYMSKSAFDFYSAEDYNLFSFSSQSGGYFFMVNDDGSPKENVYYDNPKSRELFFKVMEMSKKYSCSAGAVIVSALTSNPYFKTIPIIGCMTPGQVDDSMNGLEVKMTEEDVKSLILR